MRHRFLNSVSAKRLASTATLLFIAFFVLNLGWTHAFLVSVLSPTDCPASLVDSAKKRVAMFFGEQKSKPIFVCIESQSFGLAVKYGTTRFAPMLPEILILGPKGMNTEVAAHEWAHAEISSITSPLLRSYRLPTWFDEGVAMQLDHRQDYSIASLRFYASGGYLESLLALEAPRQFFQEGEKGKANYALSRCVVEKWLEDVGKVGLRRVLESTSWTEAFPRTEFSPFERECASIVAGPT